MNARDKFAQRRPFPFDQFQVDAMNALDEDDSVLVVAPTGSGKTLVGEYAIEKALHDGGRAFYTTPLKALSNQKFHDLSVMHGPDKVGLLTGDNVINADAPVVVMTTEVLRNMIYARSPALDQLRYVILDEVHYLQNAYRGPVWEEVIVHTPPEVVLVCLSATVSNAEELAAWIKTVRGSTVPIISEKRPVELEHHYMVSTRRNNGPLMLDVFQSNGRMNSKGSDYDAEPHRPWRRNPDRERVRPPDRVDVVEHLNAHHMLPAIYFIFSRNGCDDAVRQAVNDNVRLTSDEEKVRIRAIAEAAVETLSDSDLEVLDYGEWLHALENGIAAHHAGMVTPFKEAVETCFTQALVKVVFATETLALGINMPARTVVIEKLSKFTGERHEQLTPGEYTQLTGRAGRRGIDDVGHAVVLWSRFTPFEQVAGLASTRTYALTSAFHPTYNMAANLVRRYQPDVARHLLNLSFAQYRTDADVVRIETQLESTKEAIENAKQRAQCERGDITKWQKTSQQGASSDSVDRIMKAVANLKVGDVIDDPGTRAFRQLLVITTSQRKGHELRLGVLNPEGRRFNLTSKDFTISPHRLRHLELPKPYNPSNKEFIKRAAASLNESAPVKGSDSGGIEDCPDFAQHLNALADIERLSRERDRLETRVKARSESLARQFDRVLGLLKDLDYVREWTLTDAGEALARTYHEADLLVVECVRRGVFDGLSAQELASVASAMTYESRGPAGQTNAVKYPNPQIRARIEEIENVWQSLATAEQQLALSVTKAPDPGFVVYAYEWTRGYELSDVLGDESLSGGDFVRNVKQLVDLLVQISGIASDEFTARTAVEAAEKLNRDVVAAASAVHVTSMPNP